MSKSIMFLLVVCLAMAEDYYYKDDPPEPTDDHYNSDTKEDVIVTTLGQYDEYDDDDDEDDEPTTMESEKQVLTSMRPEDFEERDIILIVDKTTLSTAASAHVHVHDTSSRRRLFDRWNPNILYDIVSQIDEASKRTEAAQKWVPVREPVVTAAKTQEWVPTRHTAEEMHPTTTDLEDIAQTSPLPTQYMDQYAQYEIDNTSVPEWPEWMTGIYARETDARRKNPGAPSITESTAKASVLNEDTLADLILREGDDDQTGVTIETTADDGMETGPPPTTSDMTTTTESTTTTSTTTTSTTTTTTTTTTTRPRIRKTKTKSRRRKTYKFTYSTTRTRRRRTRYRTTGKRGPIYLDIPKLVQIITNLTMDYSSNLTDMVNKTLQDMSNFSCPVKTTTESPTTTTETPTTGETTTVDPYANLTGTIMAKCFVCGLEETTMPRHARCADAFAGDFMPLVPVEAEAKKKLASYRKYCRWMNVPKYYINETDPKSMWGRWTGGCSVRWVDVTGIYTQRTCRNRHRAVMGNHWASKRMAKLEMALQRVDNACIISPMATLVPLSRGISLYARFHVCVCTGSWCNRASRSQHWKMKVVIMSILVVMMTVI